MRGRTAAAAAAEEEEEEGGAKGCPGAGDARVAPHDRAAGARDVRTLSGTIARGRDGPAARLVIVGALPMLSASAEQRAASKRVEVRDMAIS
mmetsp:Transcript_14764/g.44329  ORF Transcript_14764/g.44329 Transcript_14764/m.44329 type:complete len:92 (-) Transcript_14764:24-299(-)